MRLAYSNTDPREKPPLGAVLDSSHPFLSKGVSGVWQLNENGGMAGFIADSGPHNNKVNTYNGVAWKPSIGGQGLQFSGSNSLVTGPTFKSQPLGNVPFTQFAYVLFQGGAVNFYCAGKIGADNGASGGEWIGVNGGVAVADFGSGHGSLTGSTTVTTTKPHLITSTYDGATHRVYLDGKQEASVAFSTANLVQDGVYIGTYYIAPGNNQYYWDGFIYLYGVLPYAMTADQVWKHWTEPYQFFLPPRDYRDSWFTAAAVVPTGGVLIVDGVGASATQPTSLISQESEIY
ncbi:MAG: LamG-like jellyroll fold domain-containing protein [Candidatus Dormibacteria bacterium]